MKINLPLEIGIEERKQLINLLGTTCKLCGGLVLKSRCEREYSNYTVGENTKIFGEVKIGSGAIIGSNVNIYGPSVIGDKTYIGDNCFIGFPARSELTTAVGRGDFESILKSKMKVEIGSNVIIRPGCTIYSGVKIKDNVEFGHNVLVREKTVIEKHSLIGSNVTLDGSIKIGSHVSIQTGVYISINTVVESRVFLGPYCLLLNDKYAKQKKCVLKGPVIREGASIGGNAIIMPSIIVGTGAVVGAGALVTKNVPSKTIVGGVPARKMRLAPKGWRIK
ncbi:MAG: DapH/DapD/GlmU-related protein [Candidatus Bathyarchaeia archaeon]